MLTSRETLSPYLREVFNPKEFLFKVEFGTISRLSKLVTENLVLPFSSEAEIAIVFV